MKGPPTLLLGILALTAGCADSKPDYDPGVTASDFVSGITNPFLPWTPGSSWTYEARHGDETERIDVTVMDNRRMIMGVSATVVRDTVRLNGAVIEDTFDWYAQDKKGNVWYLGEATEEYEDGKVVSTEGSWEWGKNGALPGIVMRASPVADSKPYFQEFYWDEAVDEAAVIELGRRAVTPLRTYTDTVTTREWTRLEPGIEEEATYARGVGLVLKEATKGPSQGLKEELVAFEAG